MLSSLLMLGLLLCSWWSQTFLRIIGLTPVLMLFTPISNYLPWFSLTASTSNFASGAEEAVSGIWLNSECCCLALARVPGEVTEWAKTPNFRSPCCKDNFRKHICPAQLPLNHIYDRDLKPQPHDWQIRMACTNSMIHKYLPCHYGLYPIWLGMIVLGQTWFCSVARSACDKKVVCDPPHFHPIHHHHLQKKISTHSP